ncbi:hypothetical protein [Actinomadura sp. B10D3]
MTDGDQGAVLSDLDREEAAVLTGLGVPQGIDDQFVSGEQDIVEERAAIQ